MQEKHSVPSPTAYQDKFGNLHNLHEVMIFTDCKGEWKISGLSPKDFGWNGDEKIQRYELCLKLQNDNKPQLRWTHFVYVVVWENDSIEEVKRMIKCYIGYTPQPKTMKSIYEVTQKMISAWKEQDTWYEMQDKELAETKKKGLMELLLQRYRREDLKREEERFRYRNTPTWLLYLTKEEEKELKELQRIINGRYYLDETQSYGYSHGILGLADFIKEATLAIKEIDEIRKQQEEKENNLRLTSLFEREPSLRKVVSHYIQAKKEATLYGVKEATIQLIHRLYGYTTNEKQYYVKYHEFMDVYLKPFDVSIWDLYYLVRVAVKEEEILPPAPAQHERFRNFHYGDQVLVDGRPKMVKRVGLKYLQIDQQREHLLLSQAEPYQKEKLKKIG